MSEGGREAKVALRPPFVFVPGGAAWAQRAGSAASEGRVDVERGRRPTRSISGRSGSLRVTRICGLSVALTGGYSGVATGLQHPCRSG